MIANFEAEYYHLGDIYKKSKLMNMPIEQLKAKLKQLSEEVAIKEYVPFSKAPYTEKNLPF